MVWDIQCLKDAKLKDDSINQLFNDKGVDKTPPTPPGLLITRKCIVSVASQHAQDP